MMIGLLTLKALVALIDAEIDRMMKADSDSQVTFPGDATKIKPDECIRRLALLKGKLL